MTATSRPRRRFFTRASVARAVPAPSHVGGKAGSSEVAAFGRRHGAGGGGASWNRTSDLILIRDAL